MAGKGKKWALGCGLGCGIPILIVVVLTVVGGTRMMKPFDGAVAAQEELRAAYGAREAYVPPVDGLTAERLEAFLKVRRALAPMCVEFAELGDKFRRMEELESDGDEPSKGDVFKAVGGLTSAVFGIAGNMGRFTGTRNEALLESGMGLGEYIWIYVLTYNSALGHAPNRDFGGSSGSEFSAREQSVIRAQMAAHADALAAAGRTVEAELWRSEIDHLKRTDGPGVPFADSELPAEITTALAPFRDQLDALYCPETSAFELGRVRKQGLSISAD